MIVETVGIACPNPRGTLGIAAYMAREGWEPAEPDEDEGHFTCRWEGDLYVVALQRAARPVSAQQVPPVAEQAAALGLRRVEGTAVTIWAGTDMEDAGA